MTVTRTEHDSLGEKEIPGDAYYGIQTARAADNFRISGNTLSSLPELISALAAVKEAAATANCRAGLLSPSKLEAIVRACRELREGQFSSQFIVDVFQGGAGTSTNMNVNEVIANRALEILGHKKGEYMYLHPNDDVNLSQSTNDVYPTAIRVALLWKLAKLQEMVLALADAFAVKGKEFSDVIKLGRTQLQDAVPMTLGQEFSAFATTLREDNARLRETEPLLCEVNLGGTAVGTGLNASSAYAEIAVQELSQLTGLELKRAENLIEATWDAGAFVLFSGVIKRVAVKLSKIANDLRLLSSGPRGGLGEIRLPASQPGSSIMPGKINPVIPEVVNQVCFQVIGCDLTVTLAAEAGQLQLNAMEPVIAWNLLGSMQLLTRAGETLEKQCVRGIEADRDRCRALVESSISLATALNPILGYEKSSWLAKEALRTGRRIRDLAIEAGLSAEILDTVLDPAGMAVPNQKVNRFGDSTCHE